MRAFAGFLWSEKGDFAVWNWDLNKQKLIQWVQSEYLLASQNRINGICVSKLFNNLSDIKKHTESISGNESKAIDAFLKFVSQECPNNLKQYFIDNQPHDR